MNDIIVSETGSFPLLRFALNQLLGSMFVSQLHRSERVIISRLATGVYEEGVKLTDREYWVAREVLIRWEATQPGKKVEDLHFQREEAGASVKNVLTRTECLALADSAGAADGFSDSDADDARTDWVFNRFFTLSEIFGEYEDERIDHGG
jgi:hypothetical protein